MHDRIQRWVLVAALGVWMSACGGPSLVGDVYRDDEARYRVGSFDAGWERLAVTNNDLAWHNANLGAVVQVNASCDPFQDVPLSSLTNHLLIGFTDRTRHDERRVTLDGRDALRSRYTASLDGVPRELLLYVLKKDECTYDFALIAPPGPDYAASEAAFEAFVAGFTTEVRAEP